MIKYKDSKSQLIEDGKERYLELVLRDVQLEDFRINMINNNAEKGFITLEKSKFNADTKLRYCITGYESLDTYISKNMLDKQKVIKILKGISEILLRSSTCLLNVENFILEKENIFINKENLEIKLINIPLKESYCSNINESYMKMVKDLMDYAYLNNKVQSNSAAFVVSIKSIVEDSGLTIDDFIKRIESDISSKLPNKSDKNKVDSNIKNDDIKKTIEPPVKAKNNKPVSHPIQEPKSTVDGYKNKVDKSNKPNGTENGSDKENNFEIIEKKQYKTSRIITSIIIQPIFVGIILSLLLINGVTTVQMIGGGILLLALDGVIIKNLLDPSKKETVKVRVKVDKNTKKASTLNVQAEDKKKNNKNKDKKVELPNKQAQVKKVQAPVQKPQPIQPIQPVVPNEGIEEPTDIVEEPTTFEDEGTVVETIAYLEVDNGKEVRTEEITTDNYIIGRSGNLKNYISSTSVSRQHIEIVKNNDQYFVKDLKSKNGTKLNGVRLSEGEEKELNIGDVIEIPDLVLTFKL